MADNRACAVILAAGSGTRMGAATTKQKITLLGKSVLRRALEAFEAASTINSIVVVTRADEIEFARGEAKGITKLHAITVGGSCRAISALAGFEAMPKEADVIAVHDAARCLISSSDIDKIVSYAYKYGAAIAASRITDTLKKCSEDGVVSDTVKRENMFAAATPQAFTVGNYASAVAAAGELDAAITDDSMLMERAGIEVRCVETESVNLKITTPSDLLYAEYLLTARGE